MKLFTVRHISCILIQLVVMASELLLNCVSLFALSRDGGLVLYILQDDSFLNISFAGLLIIFFSTYSFQTGLVEELARKFHRRDKVFELFFVMSEFFHAYWLDYEMAELRLPPLESTPSAPLIYPTAPFCTALRCLAPWYWILYKRESDCFAEDID